MLCKKMKRRQSGFTLIELLIVISIIALLVSILLPGMARARQRSQSLVCKNNLRSIWTGVIMYSTEFNNRVPYLEDINLTDLNADPFDEQYPTTAGVVLRPYVNEGSWVCPSAVAGFPYNAPEGEWKMTYTFSAAGPVGSGVPYRSAPHANTGGPLDPVISNYIHFDGRPLRTIDGRRYLQGSALNEDPKGNWNVRRPIISEVIGGNPNAGQFKYPHKGTVDSRLDLKNSREQFFMNTNRPGYKSAYHELHADGDRAEILLTRFFGQHLPGI